MSVIISKTRIQVGTSSPFVSLLDVLSVACQSMHLKERNYLWHPPRKISLALCNCFRLPLVLRAEVVLGMLDLVFCRGMDVCWSIETGIPEYLVKIQVMESQLEYAGPCSLADYVQLLDGKFEAHLGNVNIFPVYPEGTF